MNNPLEFIKSIKNPQEFVNNYLSKSNDPILKNLVELAKNNDIKGMENFARNAFKEQGRDFDNEFNQFMSSFKK